MKVLDNVKRKDDVINDKIEHICALKATMLSITSRIDNERVQCSKDPDKFGKVYSQIDEEERILNKMIDSFVNYKNEIMTAINKVTELKYRKLLREKYINYKEFKDIASEMNYTYEYVIELHKKALNSFYEINKELIETYKNPSK